jgi:hypothetical protein
MGNYCFPHPKVRLTVNHYRQIPVREQPVLLTFGGNSSQPRIESELMHADKPISPFGLLRSFCRSDAC